MRLIPALWAGLLVILCGPAQATPPASTDDWRREVLKEPVFGSELFVVEAGPLDGPPVLLVHGLGYDGLRDWAPVMEALKDRYRVISFDLPGFGASPLPEDARLSPANYARLIAWLIDEKSLHDIRLVGHSLGAAVALYHAAQDPRGIRKLVLVSSAGLLHRAAFVRHAAVPKPALEGLPAFLQRKAAQVLDWGNALVDRVNLLPDPTAPLHDLDPAWNLLVADYANANAALSLIHTDYSGLLERVATPVHVIWGDADRVAPPRTGHLLKARLGNARLSIIADAGHMPMRDHFGPFMAILGPALEDEPPPPPTTTPPSRGDYRCEGGTGGVLSGRYRRIVIDRCVDLRLFEVRAEHIDIRHSIVDLTRVRVDGPGPALRVQHSVLTATGLELSGDPAAEIGASRVDLAGALLHSDGEGIRVAGESLVVLSLSRLVGGPNAGYLHGAARVANTLLERTPALRSQVGAVESPAQSVAPGALFVPGPTRRSE